MGALARPSRSDGVAETMKHKHRIMLSVAVLMAFASISEQISGNQGASMMCGVLSWFWFFVFALSKD